MARVKTAELVLKKVQVLDEEVALARPLAEDPLDLSERVRVDLPTLGMSGRLAAARAWMDAPLLHQPPFITRAMVLPSAAGESATAMPALFIASIFAAAVPLPPEMMAPA